MRAAKPVRIEATFRSGTSGDMFTPGAGAREWFKDHERGPEMVIVPAGTFLLGSPHDEPEREPWEQGTEGPLHAVEFPSAFAIGRHAVTREEFAAFVDATGYAIDPGALCLQGQEWRLNPELSWDNPGFPQEADHPVVCVSWEDANAYAAWLAKTSGQPYRLPTESEREYATRAGRPTPFWWGSSITPGQANYNGGYIYAGGGLKGVFRAGTSRVWSFAANPWGLFNVHGNVWEWCEDAWHNSYVGAPADGTAPAPGDCGNRVLRGGSWINQPRFLRSATRFGFSPSARSYNFGFRVVRSLAQASS